MFASLRVFGWRALAAHIALTVTAIGGVFAAGWGLVAGFWTFSTREFGSFAIIITVATVLVVTPLISFKAISRGKHQLALVLSGPAIVIYAVALFAIASRGS